MTVHLTLLLVSLTTLFLIASAEIDDDYGVYKIKQKSGCPTIYCPWNCERYLDRKGCIYCGKCQPKNSCPEVTCPNLPYFQCMTATGMDGCTVCKCREKIAPHCPLTPLCSQGCQLKLNENGCPACDCPDRTDCPAHLQKNAPCQRGCWREEGPDGCYHCRCSDDVDVCPEVPCPPPCRHTINPVTGCAVGCSCPVNNYI